jgi:gas vesicle protein
MLGASVVALLLVSALVAFGSWPGESSGREVDQLLLKEVASAKPHNVAVGEHAVKVARQADAKRRVAVVRAERKEASRTADGKTVAAAPKGSTTPTTGAAGTPIAALPGGTNPTTKVKQQTQDLTQGVTNNLDTTTNQVTDQVQNTVDQTTTQVDQVVDQVVSGVQQQTQTTVQQVQNTVDTTTGTVTDTTGGLLGH